MAGAPMCWSWLIAVLLAGPVDLSRAEEEFVSAASSASDLCRHGSDAGLQQSCGDGVGHDDRIWEVEEDGIQAFEEVEAAVMRVDLLQTTLSLKRARSTITDHAALGVEVTAGQSAEPTAASAPEVAYSSSAASGGSEQVLETAEAVDRKVDEELSLRAAANTSHDNAAHAPSPKWTAKETRARIHRVRQFLFAGLGFAMVGFGLLQVYIQSMQKPPISLKPQAVDSLVAASAAGPRSLQQALYGNRASIERGDVWDFRSEGVRPPLAAASSLKGWGAADAAAGHELPPGVCQEEYGLAGQRLTPRAADEAPGSTSASPLCLDVATPPQHEPLLIMPYDCVGEGASSFDVVAASGEPVLHVALRGAAGGGRSLEVSRVPARGKALASVRAEPSSSGQGHSSFVLSSGCGGAGLGGGGSVWGSLRPPPAGGHGSSVLVRHSDGEVVASLPAPASEGHLRLVTASGETGASSLVACAGDFVAGTRQLEICIRHGLDPVLVLCCFMAPLVLSPPPRCSERASRDDGPADVAWGQSS